MFRLTRATAGHAGTKGDSGDARRQGHLRHPVRCWFWSSRCEKFRPRTAEIVPAPGSYSRFFGALEDKKCPDLVVRVLEEPDEERVLGTSATVYGACPEEQVDVLLNASVSAASSRPVSWNNKPS